MEFAWLSLFLALGGLRGARGLQEVDVFPSLGGDIRDFTVAARWVYVVTGDYLYQLNLSLGLLHSLTQRGDYFGSSASGQFNRNLEGGTSTFSVNTLAPLVERNLLFTCGALNCGFWIFTDHDVTITELAVYDVSPPTDAVTYTDPDFGFKGKPAKGDVPIALRPLRVLLKHRFMTSVLAVKLNNWLIVFIGTGVGQLLKLTVDATLQAQCLSVIWKAPDDRRVFPKMHLDPVGRKHVFVAVRDKLMRVPVSQCVQHSSLQSCWNARDPYCGWCGALRRCSFEDECPSSLWLSVPDDLSQRRILSHSFQEDAEGKIRLAVFTHLKRGGAPANFSCRFDSSVGVLGGLGHRYPECTCLLPPVIGGLWVSVTVSLGEVDVTEELNLLNCSGITGAPTPLLCSQCLAAGCGWSNGACTWTRSGALNMNVCFALQTGVNSLPEIFSITPSELSFYGKNNAVLTGRNLGHVIGVRLQGDLDCSAKEASVRLNTGASLTFHIPAGDKGRVEVCLLLPVGSCHGNASLTYLSAPVCASIAPDSTWASGKRKMNISGSNLEFVEEVTHSHTNQKVTFSKTGDGASLKFESLATDRDPFSSSVTLRITYGAKTVLLEPHRYFMVFLIRLIIVILVGLTMWGCIYYYRPRLAAQMNMSTGDLEIYLWADIRQVGLFRTVPIMRQALALPQGPSGTDCPYLPPLPPVLCPLRHFPIEVQLTPGDVPISLRPLRVLLKHRFMTSVLAVKLDNWLIVFIGTGDGQLLKLTVDAKLQAQCLSVIWKAPDDRRVFPKMHLDPVGRKHVFVAVRDTLMRVPVSQCVQHSSLQSCWNARDPYCGRCGALRRCSFEDECPSSLWLSVPDDLSQRRILSHSFQEDAEGKIRLAVFTHLKRGGAPANFSCRFDSSVGVLGGLGHRYPE
ncbi:unnamed protein product [Gadus morhua 'NCC']